MKSLINCPQSLFLDATYRGLSTSFQISFCNPLPSSIPVNTFLFSHILPMHSFLLPFILRLLCFIILYSFGSKASEMSTTLPSLIFLSNASSLFLIQTVLFSPHAALTTDQGWPLPSFFLGTYILATSLLGCSSLFIVMIFLDRLRIYFLKFLLIPFNCSCSIPQDLHSQSVYCMLDLVFTIELRFYDKFEPP